MRKILLALFGVLLVTLLVVLPALAGEPHFSSVRFSLGSLIADGTVAGLGKEDVTVILTASGIPETTCTNQGGNSAPGQNPARVSASDGDVLPGNDPLRKNGKSPFSTEAIPPTSLAGLVGGCANNNWTATINFVYWTQATLQVVKTSDPSTVLEVQNYKCTTTKLPASVTCTRIP
jgi:hypothetical protein